MRRLLYLISALVVVAGLATAGAGFWTYGSFTRPGPLTTDTVLVIERGSGVNAIARQLAAGGVIADPLIFRLGVRFISEPGSLKAGEYLFPKGISSLDAVRLLQDAKTVVRRVTFAEGLTSAQIYDQLMQVEGLAGDIEGPVEEGVLLPETYHFSYGDSRAEIIARMRSAMSELISEHWELRDPGLPLKTADEALVLASIVEKETGVASERSRVAAVFVNRLRKGMRLQSDPTVIYGITGGKTPLGRPLRRSELKADTPYNTYKIKGLPPTPIANPGRLSVRAVLHPSETDELYFVADGTGGHVFARTLKEHNRNVAKWRKIERARKNGG